ncbi:signal peptidase I [Bacillus andreraoultii]|uniref:signal peptidase I n=1 Tax=Bacillus andreraoultii TaxID=1499685 RepID=UPI000AD934C4|nr:signal peptidase I [Bacillus andreraoultii]
MFKMMTLKTTQKKSIKSWLSIITTGIIFAFLIYKFLFFVIIVPSGSMFPTIQPQDRIITTRIYDVDQIKRQDIIVFYSKELDEIMVKRIIGLPNDIVEIKGDGLVYINGQELKEPYVKYSDQLTGTYQVPDGKYLFLGDNRRHSYDSRKWVNPYIDASNIEGKAVLTIFPLNRISLLE